MKQYIDLCKHVLKNGQERKDRTGTGTLSTFGYQMRIPLKDEFPLLTTKRVYWNGIVHELLWFISGSTNIQYLVKNNVNIWNQWPYENFKKSQDFSGETIDEYRKLLTENEKFAKKWGELGPVYGKQWRDFGGVDQLKQLLNNLVTNPSSRRHIVSSWNVPEVSNMLLPPCHMIFQFYVSNGKLSCHLYQRSADVFLGVPFNIASYSLLTYLISNHVGLKPGEFIHTLGDAHIYKDHIDVVKKQITRKPRTLPRVILNDSTKDIFKISINDIELKNYNPYPRIKGKISV